MEFKTFLKNNKDSRKIFGKKELEIIFKQLDGITLTQSERNRLSRDIKPKLEFIKEASAFKDEFRLKKDQNTTKIIDRVVQIALQDILADRIKVILLFGSHAGGLITPRSDIDICVIFKEITKKEADKFRLRILAEVPDKADIQVFNVLPQKLKREIARNHRVLYKNKDFDNTSFTIRYLKDEDYFIRMKRIIGEAA